MKLSTACAALIYAEREKERIRQLLLEAENSLDDTIRNRLVTRRNEACAQVETAMKGIDDVVSELRPKVVKFDPPANVGAWGAGVTQRPEFSPTSLDEFAYSANSMASGFTRLAGLFIARMAENHTVRPSATDAEQALDMLQRLTILVETLARSLHKITDADYDEETERMNAEAEAERPPGYDWKARDNRDAVHEKVDWDAVGHEVVLEAWRYFEECPEDFCFQAQGESVVFGGTNRLIWSFRRGFKISESHCTEKFLDHARKIKAQESLE